MNDVLAPDGPLAKQLAYLEKMHPGDGPYFNNQTTKRVAGAYAIAAMLDIAVRKIELITIESNKQHMSC